MLGTIPPFLVMEGEAGTSPLLPHPGSGERGLERASRGVSIYFLKFADTVRWYLNYAWKFSEQNADQLAALNLQSKGSNIGNDPHLYQWWF